MRNLLVVAAEVPPLTPVAASAVLPLWHEYSGSVLFWLIFLAIYFIPSMVANSRERRDYLGIFLLNLFLGWSGLGWFAAFVWAVSSEPAAEKPAGHTDPVDPSRPRIEGPVRPASVINALERLAKLKEAGHLTDVEYADQKGKLLASESPLGEI